MNEHPILFSEPMVKAILEGRKTQTRRVVTNKTALDWLQPGCFSPEFVADPGNNLCRYGYAGDYLWVREAWQAQNTNGQWWHEVPRADRPLWNWAWTNPIQPACKATPPRWLPSIHMLREACRIELEIVNVRVERLQSIGGTDAWQEGGFTVSQFIDLWNSINAARGYGWDVNPRVWFIEFQSI